MGLSITSYSKLRPVGKHVDDRCKDATHIDAFTYESFPRSFRGIEVLAVDLTDGLLVGGCYETTDETQTHSFHGGSGGGYNVWRKNLADQFNPQPIEPDEGVYGEPDPGGPFYELIWFSDCEGVIGPEAAADLLADFREYSTQYVAPLSSYRSLFNDFMYACELAADGGLIRFG